MIRPDPRSFGRKLPAEPASSDGAAFVILALLVAAYFAGQLARLIF
jgi:hypothetical protein